ncbi:ABC transporter ATP-binding protein [Pelagibius sp. Alg239-R121]|uniref:ABC transporter ATP-binding protein n=1 Tax=Pelagibius sp. Alg239-R121 TaxID=2993448 RepID=UPI0024A660F8|nr:ABC transporter ATP-binding protein [Pelagibius sp. Alg239-R121]
MNTYLSLQSITKKFGDFKALDSVDMDIAKASIHAILGENGAGKTTLMNIIYGLYQPDGGRIFLNGNEAVIPNPREALHMGIGMIHQHLMLVDTLTVTENVILGLEGVGLSISLKEHEERIAELSREFDFEVDPRAEIWKLPMGMRQRVEILKVLYRDVDLLILDEPTSVLAPNEIEAFLAGLDRLRAAGKTIVFITHKLDEVAHVGDRITVMRHGKVTGNTDIEHTDTREMARMMVGRDVVMELEKPDIEPGGIALEFENAVAINDRGLPALKGVNLSVRRGEVIGIAGVDGNGQVELAEIATGMRQLESGSVRVDGIDVSETSVHERRHKHCIGYVPEDRHGTGLVLDFSVSKNCMLRDFSERPFSENTLIKSSVVDSIAEKWVEDYDIRLQSIYQQTRFLSGGNQQKLVFAREVESDPDILVVMQPCKGLDIGAIEAVQNTILGQKRAGKAVLYISTELDDILAVCDRICVMCDGEISGVVTPEEATPERMGMLIAGIREASTC